MAKMPRTMSRKVFKRSIRVGDLCGEDTREDA